ncbi:hypothetical protein T484DRAFT_1980589 [Baffinella frigidus]|nr:hypothetical protein T484DRAFT_1980589 [Cryptophyta sp. CCMP2293]
MRDPAGGHRGDRGAQRHGEDPARRGHLPGRGEGPGRGNLSSRGERQGCRLRNLPARGQRQGCPLVVALDGLVGR